MEDRWPSEASEQVAVLLRSKYRCDRCYKNCQVPCRFTAEEFRRLVRAVCSICQGHDPGTSEGSWPTDRVVPTPGPVVDTRS